MVLPFRVSRRLVASFTHAHFCGNFKVSNLDVCIHNLNRLIQVDLKTHFWIELLSSWWRITTWLLWMSGFNCFICIQIFLNRILLGWSQPAPTDRERTFVNFGLTRPYKRKKELLVLNL